MHVIATPAAAGLGARARAPSVLLAGVAPGEAAGNSVSSTVLGEALGRVSDLGLLTHHMSPLPSYHVTSDADRSTVRLGTQPFAVHGEALLAGRVHRRKLRAWDLAWAVNSRYAGAVLAARVPYVIWEATTVRDELRAIDVAEIRRGGTGSGVGALLHGALMPLGEHLQGRFYRGAVRLLAMSEYTRERMSATHQLAPGMVEVLDHPPTLAYLNALATARDAEVAPRRAEAEHALRTIFVGRVDDPRKNFPLLLRAVRLLRANGLPITLTVIGPHTERWRHSIGLADHDDVVRLRGHVTLAELAAAYLSHDVLVVPSRQEGFGIVVAEALHAGLPVISTRCGGPEATIRASGGGVLVEHDADAMAAALANLAASPRARRELGDRGARYARDVLSFERFASRVAEVTAAALAEAGR
ncbi:MAG: glycosyltransferase family 4 protein [Gemmatimonadaceae bacterium]